MPQSRPLNALERNQWIKFSILSKIIALEVRKAQYSKKQCEICAAFAAENNIALPNISEVNIILTDLERVKLKLGRILEGVESENIGLSFPSGPSADFNIVADPEMNSDELAFYQLNGVVFIVAGLVLIAGAIAYAYYERSQTKKVIERHEAVKSVAEAKFCSDPQSEICARWLSFRQAQGYDDQQGFVDDLYDNIVSLQNSLPGAISTGVSWAIPVAVLLAAFFLLRGEKQ